MEQVTDAISKIVCDSYIEKLNIKEKLSPYFKSEPFYQSFLVMLYNTSCIKWEEYIRNSMNYDKHYAKITDVNKVVEDSIKEALECSLPQKNLDILKIICKNNISNSEENIKMGTSDFALYTCILILNSELLEKICGDEYKNIDAENKAEMVSCEIAPIFLDAVSNVLDNKMLSVFDVFTCRYILTDQNFIDTLSIHRDN